MSEKSKKPEENKKSEKSKKGNYKSIRELSLLFMSVLFVVSLWLSCYHYITIKRFSQTEGEVWAMRGQFGDMFGAVNALFSGLAFAGIIFTIYLQRQELKAQRDELRLTRKEFKRQNITLKRQRFETTFFNMLNLHFDFIQSVSFNHSSGPRTFIAIISHLGSAVKDNLKYTDRSFRFYSETYQQFDDQMHFSNYFQSLIALHKLILSYSKQSDTMDRYFKILKSYISLPERIFLFYHILFSSNSGVNNALRELDKDLGIINEVPRRNLIDNSHFNFLSDPNR